MGKRCGNCANSTWLKGMDAVPEICLKCKYVHGEPSNWKEKTITNADRIRAMSDEELKEFICSILQCKFCKFEGWGGCELLEWLKQPVEEV